MFVNFCKKSKIKLKNFFSFIPLSCAAWPTGTMGKIYAIRPNPQLADTCPCFNNRNIQN